MRKTVPYLAAWFVAGVAAVVLAAAGLDMVGRQLTGSRPAPLSAEQVRRELASEAATSTTAPTVPTTTTVVPATTSSSTGSTDGGGGSSPAPTTTTTTAAPPAPTTRSYDLVGGTATVQFSAGGATVLSASPKPGFEVEVSGSHSNGIRVEFESDDHESRLDAWWDGGPRDEVREED